MPTFSVIDTGSGQDTFYEGMVKDAANWAILEAVYTSLVTLTGSQALSNKTLTTPIIASFVNATHNHTSDATGGLLATFKVISATRAMDAATGSVTYTGAGFTPKAVRVDAICDLGRGTSRGFATGTGTDRSISSSTSTSQQTAGNTLVNCIEDSTTKLQTAVFNAWTSDGCTMDWVRTGATAAGNALLIITFYR